MRYRGIWTVAGQPRPLTRSNLPAGYISASHAALRFTFPVVAEGITVINELMSRSIRRLLAPHALRCLECQTVICPAEERVHETCSTCVAP